MRHRGSQYNCFGFVFHYRHSWHIGLPYFALRATKGILREFRYDGMPFVASARKRRMAERVGFEPTEPFGSPVFKTGAIDHSTTSPEDA